MECVKDNLYKDRDVYGTVFIKRVKPQYENAGIRQYFLFNVGHVR